MKAKEKKCSDCGNMRPIFKNITEDGVRLRLCTSCARSHTTPKKNTTRHTPIKQFSDKRAKRSAAYNVAKTIFMMLDKNKFCPVMSYLHGKTVPTTDIHHTNGRENDRLTDQEYWLAVSREGHDYIHANMDIAREQGWITHDYKDE